MSTNLTPRYLTRETTSSVFVIHRSNPKFKFQTSSGLLIVKRKFELTIRKVSALFSFDNCYCSYSNF